MKYLFIPFILLVSLFSVNAQNNLPLNSYKNFNRADSSQLFFRFENLNFIKNKEYSSYFVKGETLLGYLATPKLVYYPSIKVRIEGGARLQRYFGRNGFSDIQPIFSLIYKPNSNHTIIMGALNQNSNHQLSDVMLNSEFYYTKNAENGLQYTYNSQKFQLDTWLNWKQFIFDGDPFQEKLTFGISGNLYLIKNTAKNSLSVPLSILLNHEGGQIDTSPKSVLTMINMASGLKWEHKTNGAFLKSWDVKMMAYFFTNKLSKRDFVFQNGYALYPQIGFRTKKSTLNLGYYTPYHFTAPNGSTIFSSNLNSNDTYFNDRNNLITAGYSFKHQIANGIDLGTEWNFYYRLNDKKLYFDMGLYVSANLDFFITKL